MKLRVKTIGYIALLPLLLGCRLSADDRFVDFDPNRDFSDYATFAFRAGVNTAKAPELNSALVKSKIESAIREQLTARHFREENTRPDLIVNYRLGAANRAEVERWPAGRWGRRTVIGTHRFTEGTLVIDVLERQGRELLWRGVYRDDESNAAKVSRKLDDDVKKLFEKFPVKKK